MLVDLIKPTSGVVEICGFDVQTQHNQALRYVGCIVENPELYSFMTGWQNLEHYARMLPDTGEQRIHEVVDIVGMDQRIHDKVKTYSLGMRQRLGIDAITVYAYRHSFATDALLAGNSLAVVAELLGHSDTRMVGKVYGHLDQQKSHLLDAVNETAKKRLG
jgi:ABC-type polysaccharide/polyol phosphate transport system ATPase subunit